MENVFLVVGRLLSLARRVEVWIGREAFFYEAKGCCTLFVLRHLTQTVVVENLAG